MIAPNDHGQQLQREVMEDLAEDHLADDDGGQADDDGAAAHVDVGRSPDTGLSSAPARATRPLEIIRPSTFATLVLMPCARAMFWLAPVARREQPISVPKNQ